MSFAYLIENETGLVLVDAGAPGSEHTVLQRMRALQRDDLRLIWITHGHLDHYGSASALRRITGAPVAIHSADAQAMTNGETPLGTVRGLGRLFQFALPLIESHMNPEPTPPDILFGDNQDLRDYGLNARAIHTPGHTPGSSCLLVEERLAFVGDLLSTRGWPHAQKFFAQDWSLIPHSLRRLRALAPSWVYTGHGRRPLRGEHLPAPARS